MTNHSDDNAVPGKTEKLSSASLRLMMTSEETAPDSVPRLRALVTSTPTERTSGTLPSTKMSHPMPGNLATKGSVLLVDDDPDILCFLAMYLEHHSLACYRANNGAEALSLASTCRPDLIVLDASLPDMSGFEICDELRQQKDFAKTPIIFLSSNEEEERMLWAYELGADDYVTKPFNARTLSLKIKNAVRRHRQQRPLSELHTGQEVLQRFTVDRELGRGGAGIVYLAREKTTGRKLALKTLSPDKATPEERQRLQREIELLSQLRHPGIVPVVEHRFDHTPPLYIMPYYEKGSLADHLAKKGALSIEESLDMAACIAGALQCAHEQGILHRDLKTDNIMLSLEGHPVVTDFGVAVQIHKAESRLTQTGMFAGTPKYMSPDQLLHPTSLDVRSDIFTMGLLLFEMLTGKSPFQGMIASEIMVNLTTKNLPSPRQHRADLPLAVEQLCRKALRKDREKRFQTAAAFRRACQEVQETLYA